MAKALLMSGGVGGVSSDDVTAKRWHVVQGYTALTSDSGDEPVNGELANKGNGGASNGVICPEMFYYTLEGAYTARFDAGAYYNAGERGQWKPYVSVPGWMVKQATNYHPEKTLSDTVTCNERGQIKMVNTQDNGYTVNQAKFFAIDPPRGKLVMGLGHGNAYYHRNDNNPHVEVDVSLLGTAGADKVMRGFTATSEHGIKFAGTMPDLQSGRVVFNGATFDNELVSGVADKPFFIINDYYANYVSDEYRYSGIWGGGMNFSLTTFFPTLLGRWIGCVLSQSINLSPFSRIVISYNLSGTVKNNPNINLECFVSPLRSLKRGGMDVQGVGNIDGFYEALAVVRAGSVTANRQGQLTLDVRNIDEQAFLSLTASITVANSRESFSGALQITKIEFIN